IEVRFGSELAADLDASRNRVLAHALRPRLVEVREELGDVGLECTLSRHLGHGDVLGRVVHLDADGPDAELLETWLELRPGRARRGREQIEPPTVAQRDARERLRRT